MTINNSPIFIHSLFRSGSTYFFNVFRRSKSGYFCYYEPFNELLIHLNENPENLLDIREDKMAELCHPQLSKPYFWEFYEIRDSMRGLFRKSFSYDDFFVRVPPGLPEDQKEYLGALILNAKGRPVLEGCRTAGRVAALKDSFGGVHIHLWREPRNQWWSYKVTDFFDASVQRILNGNSVPAVLKNAKEESGIADFHCENISMEFEHAFKHPLSSGNNYYAFFALWLFSYLECEKHSDVTINIDLLSADQKYRIDLSEELIGFGIDELDFSDCSIPRLAFSDQDICFFEEVETRVFNLFLRHGYDEAELRKTQEIIEVVRSPKLTHKDMVRDIARSHHMIRHYMDRIAMNATALAQEQAQSQWLQNEWDAAKARVVELATALGQEEARSQRLQNEWDAAKAKVVELTTALGQEQARSQRLQNERDAAKAEVVELTTALGREQARSQWLQNEWDAAKARVVELATALGREQARSPYVQNEWDATKAKLNELTTALGQEQARSQWLQNEWDAAKAKIDELNYSSHHWWTVADGLNRDLQAIYASRSWRITRPLRALGRLSRRARNGIRAIPPLIVLVVKTMTKPLVARAIRFTMARPALKKPAAAWVHRFPELETRLRHRAQAWGIVGHAPGVQATVASSVPASQLTVNNERLILMPDAQCIYEEIRTAIAQHQKKEKD